MKYSILLIGNLNIYLQRHIIVFTNSVANAEDSQQGNSRFVTIYGCNLDTTSETIVIITVVIISVGAVVYLCLQMGDATEKQVDFVGTK